MKIGFASADWSHTVFDESGHPVWGGSGWARLGQFANLLDHEVVCGMLIGDPKRGLIGVREYSPERTEDGEWREWNWNGGANHMDCDVVVVQRIMFEGACDAVGAAVASGQIVVNDVDDWYWGLSTQNSAFYSSHPRLNPQDNVNNYRKVLARSSHITVSTPYLAERLKSFVRCPIDILPNTVDFSRFSTRVQAERPAVGWAGSTMHRSGDLEILRGVAGQITRNGYQLVHAGNQEWAPSFASAVNVDPESVTTLPLVGPEEYPSILQFDIGLIPLTDVPFNLAKSTIKSLEYTAAGIPFIASRVGEYARQKKETGAGRLVKNHGDWMKHIRALDSVSAREEEVAANRSALAEFDIKFGVQRLNDYLESIVRG
jgi:glycosyltransferase involved in cell wall biosynthesis